MKNLSIYAILSCNAEEAYSTKVEGRKATQRIEAEYYSSLVAKTAQELKDAMSVLDGKDTTPLKEMGWNDLQRSLRLAAAYKAEKLAEEAHKNLLAKETLRNNRRAVLKEEFLSVMNDRVAFMVQETLEDLKWRLFQGKRMTYGEAKCLLKGLATAAARQIAGSKGLDKVFNRTLSKVLWNSSTVRYMISRYNLAKDSQESKAWKEIKELLDDILWT